MNSDQSFFDNIGINPQELSAKDQSLLAKVWQSSKRTDSGHSTVSSGYSKLDALFANQGWPLGVTTEIGLAQPGIGELRLLLPAIRSLQQRHSSAQHVLWIAPPLNPFASSLAKEGVDLDLLTIVEIDNASQAIWAAEQALLSNSCAAVIVWMGKWRLENKTLRCLQLAAEKSVCWNVVFRHESCLQQASISHLRLNLQATPLSELDIHILKQPNSWANQHCRLSLSPHYARWQRLPVDLLPHTNQPFIQKYQKLKTHIEERITDQKVAESETNYQSTQSAQSKLVEISLGPD